MHSLTGYQESVRFIGLFGLLVYFTMHTFTGEWDCVRFIRREVRHHRKHMLDDPPNMIDPINYVLLFCSIPLFKSFHVACMDNYVLKVTVIYLHLWWSCLVYWENAWKNKGPTQKKITGLFGNFSHIILFFSLTGSLILYYVISYKTIKDGGISPWTLGT